MLVQLLSLHKSKRSTIKNLIVPFLLVIGFFAAPISTAFAISAGAIVPSAIAPLLLLDDSVNHININGEDEAVLGTTIDLTALAVLNDDDIVDVTNKATWSSTNTDIEVDAEGHVSAIATGDADITAEYQGVISAIHSVRFTAAVLDHLEIQESYIENGEGKVITDTTQIIQLVDSVSYPNDPDGLSPNAYYPTVWAVYTDGRKEYVNQEALWWSDDQNAAFINSLKGSFVFGKDIKDNVTITAKWPAIGGMEASFDVNVVAQENRTLESIEIKNGWDENLPTITEVDVVEGARTPLVAYGWFIDDMGNRTREYINQNVSWSSSNLSSVWIQDFFSSYAYGITANTSAVITAAWQGVSSQVTVNVLVDTSPTLVSIEIQKSYTADGSGEVYDADNPLFMLAGDVQYVTAWGNYSDGSKVYINTDVFWTSQNYSVASMDFFQRDSDVTAIALGSTTISAELDEITGTAPVKVVEIDSLSVEGTDEIALGASAQLYAILHLYDGTDITAHQVNDKVNWTTSDAAVATVDASGVVSSIAEGPVTITATAKNNGAVSGTHNLAVVEAALESIQIEHGYNPGGAPILTALDVTIETEEYLTAWGIYSDGSRRYINTDAFWWSSDQQIASINFLDSSNVYGRELGNATITAYYGGKQASIDVTVIGEDGVSLIGIAIRDGWGGPIVNGGQIDIEVGAKSAVVAYGYFSDGSSRDINAKVFWSSSDLSIAFILDEIDSYVHGISVGTATIMATWQGVSSSVTANIVASTAPTLDSIEIQLSYVADGSGEVVDTGSNPIDIVVGQELYITAWGNYSNGSKEYINTEVIWLSEDQTIASMPILQTSSNVTGVKVGSTEVYATLDGKEGRATVNVAAP